MSNLLNEFQGNTITDHVSNVTTTFTSWDKCMLQSYCKWPAVIGIAIGGIVALSIISCVTRCLCCGYSFCCSCFSFLSCCGSCGGCCDGRRRKSDRYKSDLSSNNRNQGYSAPPPMMKGGFKESQVAHFPTSKANSSPLNEDALPAMPSWDTATSVHVLDDSADSKGMELNQINSSTGQKVPLLTAAAASGISSPLNQENAQIPFQSRSLSNINNGFVNPNDSSQRRVLQNFNSKYSPNPYSENMIGENGTMYGGLSSPISGRGYRPPLQSQYPEAGRSTPIQAPYPEAGRSTPIQAPYPEGGRSTPIQAPYYEGGRSTPIQAPYYEGGRSTPIQAPYPEGGRSTPIQAPYHEGGRSTHSYKQAQLGSQIPDGRTQVREYGQPPQSQRPAMGYQGYRV
ncbi:putative fibroin-3 related protein [Erysiphe neolycopersici]|uniref:Putative fibroin-3 related protein n=1 Tax=Erysiphe neolycopersici TaxID=212602 RepID=A0A420HKZ4_9PEZI|nr:putative fibroin-3 related protein [Erysiphe neolycopersici]